MSHSSPESRKTRPRTKGAALRRSCLAFAALIVFSLFTSHAALAQRKVTRDYPAQPNIRVQLLNRSGTIEVVAWDRSSVRVTATMMSSSAKLSPEVNGDGVFIDVRRDNREDPRECARHERSDHAATQPPAATRCFQGHL